MRSKYILTQAAGAGFDALAEVEILNEVFELVIDAQGYLQRVPGPVAIQNSIKNRAIVPVETLSVKVSR